MLLYETGSVPHRLKPSGAAKETEIEDLHDNVPWSSRDHSQGACGPQACQPFVEPLYDCTLPFLADLQYINLQL